MKEEKILLNAGGDYPLNGLLTLPAGEGPFPAVVFVHGSGSSNMDEKVGKLTPFRDLAHGLAEHGIASLRYDKRTFTHGRKMVRNKNLVITLREETIEDAVAAVELLKHDTRIDAARVYVAGHSMGAMLAPRIDAEGADCAGLILMAGTLRTLEDVMRAQLEEAVPQLNPLTRLLLSGYFQKTLAKFEGLYDLTDEQARAVKVAGGTTLYYFKEAGERPAAAYLTALNKPVLILQGSKDLQVKAEVDFEGYKTLLKDRPNVTFRLYEGLNHAFVPALYDTFSKAAKEFSVERHIGPEVIGDMADWILTQAGAAPTCNERPAAEG